MIWWRRECRTCPGGASSVLPRGSAAVAAASACGSGSDGGTPSSSGPPAPPSNGSAAPFEHVVLLTMENRSFDHLHGVVPRGQRQASRIVLQGQGRQLDPNLGFRHRLPGLHLQHSGAPVARNEDAVEQREDGRVAANRAGRRHLSDRLLHGVGGAHHRIPRPEIHAARRLLPVAARRYLPE